MQYSLRLLHLPLWPARLFPRTPLAVTTGGTTTATESNFICSSKTDPAACRVFLRRVNHFKPGHSL
jgi:hypothetical protein